MPRAIIRIVVREISDEKALELKKKADELVKDVPEAEIEFTLMAR